MKERMNLSRLYALGLLLILTGIAIMVLGSLGSGSASTSFGRAVFIGPFPIVFGDGPGSGLVTLTASVMTGFMVIALYLSILRRGYGKA